MPTKAELSARIAHLEHALAAEQRALNAAQEWLLCELRGHATLELDVCPLADGAPVLRVIVHGMGRASGGVAVVCHGDDTYRDLPRYLDDVIAEWRADSCAEIRAASRTLSARRDEYNAVAS